MRQNQRQELPPRLVSGRLADAEEAMAASRGLMSVAARSLTDVVDKGVTLAQFRALVIVSRSGGILVGDLAEALSMQRSGATRLVDRLEHAGLITRSVRPVDRRGVVIRVTIAGENLVHDVMERRRAEIAAILARLSQPQRDHVIDGFRLFAEAAAEHGAEVDLLGW